MGDILFLAHRVPFPPNRGDTIRSANLLRKLASLAPVHVGCFSEGVEQASDLKELTDLAASNKIVRRSKPLVLAGAEAVLSRKPVSLTAFHSPKIANWVKETIETRDIATIFVFSGQMGQYIPDEFDGNVVVDLCDVDSAKFESYAAAGQRAWLNAREGRLLAREEERLARRANATILISEHEAQLFKSRLQFPSMANVHVVGNGIDAGLFDPESTEPLAEIAKRPGPHFVFTGQMDYSPNEQAALWALDEFFASYRSKHQTAEFHVVGRAPTGALKAQGGRDGVTIWGEVPDIRPFISAAHCVVVPLTIARGVQNKVLEAMAMAKPVMLTREAATGIDAQNGVHWLVCDAERDAMSRRVEVLLSDPVSARELGDSARRYVLDHHDWGAKLAPLSKLVTACAEEARNAA